MLLHVKSVICISACLKVYAGGILQKTSRLDIRKYVFSLHIFWNWNNLPRSTVEAESIIALTKTKQCLEDGQIQINKTWFTHTNHILTTIMKNQGGYYKVKMPYLEPSGPGKHFRCIFDFTKSVILFLSCNAHLNF